jgi:hypothetical protein
MSVIPDNFCGYVDIGKDRFVCSVSGHMVKLMPAHQKTDEIRDRVFNINGNSSELPMIIEGFDEQAHQIAFLRYDDFKPSLFSLARTPYSISFGSPIIIRAHGFSSQIREGMNWTDFDALVIENGSLNAVYNPKEYALKRPTAQEDIEHLKCNDGTRNIEIKPFDEYTQTFDVNIDGQKANLCISVKQDGEDRNQNTTSLGSVFSFLRLSFNEPQKIDKFERYYNVLSNFISILTKQKNHKFTTLLKQKLENTDTYFTNAVCKLNDGYENYFNSSSQRVITITDIKGSIPNLINVISTGTASALLAVLPDDNRNLRRISTANVQDLCAALEIEYKNCKSDVEKDKTIAELKEAIKIAVKDFTKAHPEIDEIDKQTTIKSTYTYLNYSFKEQVMHIYNEHKETIDELCSERKYPTITDDRFGKFKKLRDNLAHRGEINWENNGEMYFPLLSLVYACLLKRAGCSEDRIKSLLKKIF